MATGETPLKAAAPANWSHGCLVRFSGIELFTMPASDLPSLRLRKALPTSLNPTQRRLLAAPTLALAFVLQLNIVGRGCWPAGSLFGWLLPILALLLPALNGDEVWSNMEAARHGGVARRLATIMRGTNAAGNARRK